MDNERLLRMTGSNMNILGIDYGTRRIGLAISIGKLAEPLHILPNTEETLDQLQQIVTEHQVEKIVLGLSDRQMAEQTKEFAEELKATLHLPVEFVDESYSSVQVQQLLRESGKLNKIDGPIDHYVASFILQEYLDTSTG